MSEEHKNITQQTITIAREAIDLALAYSGGDSETAQELETQLDEICLRHSDARLIASAPDLLRALEWIVDDWERVTNRTLPDDHEAKAAIAKAKGQE